MGLLPPSRSHEKEEEKMLEKGTEILPRTGPHQGADVREEAGWACGALKGVRLVIRSPADRCFAGMWARFTRYSGF